MTPPQVIVFVKAPHRGRVKTRLGRGIGEGAAVAFYRRQTAALLARLRDRRWRVRLWVTPDGERGARFWPAGLPRTAQGAGDLGTRMAAAFRSLPRGPAVLIGSDIPDLGVRQVAEAFRLLRGCPVVFGPAVDGGYWLVGIRSPPLPRGMFRGVRWSSAHALADTVAGLGGGRVRFLAPLRDVDTAEDHRAWAESGRAGGRISRRGGARAP